MDQIVKAAMRKWPSVPHCYGWLALDRAVTGISRDGRPPLFPRQGQPRTTGCASSSAQLRARCARLLAERTQRVYVEEAAPWVFRLDVGTCFRRTSERGRAWRATEPPGWTSAGLFLDFGARLDTDVAAAIGRHEHADGRYFGYVQPQADSPGA
jgi:hypothetical protein